MPSDEAPPPPPTDPKLRAELEQLALHAGTVFSPSVPIDQRNLFAGRVREIKEIIDAISTRGQHVVVYGERGVGKTSLVNILKQFLQGPIVVRVSCHGEDSFESLWRRAFAEITYQVQSPKVGFDASPYDEAVALSETLPSRFASDAIVSVLRRFPARMVFIFDEYDQVTSTAVSSAFSQTIKALSDFAVDSTVILVGVGDSVDDLVRAHASIDRALVQIRMPRMTSKELAEIVEKAATELQVEFDADAKDMIVSLAQGLPHYVHLLGLYATRDALTYFHRKHIAMASVNMGITRAVDKAQRTLLDAYTSATNSNQKGHLFAAVLLACALAKPDDQGYFAPASVRKPLKRIAGRELDIPAFSHHLHEFLQPERGEVLTRIGQERRWRYRFRDPLLQPLVVLKGLAKKTITAADIEAFLGFDLSKVNE